MAQQFTCNPLSAIPRVHNFAASNPSVHFQQKLVVASKFEIAVAVSSNHELASFRTTVAHEPSSGAFNDVNKVQTKVTPLDPQWEIVSIGLNADETLLGVFANNQHGCFVHIYDVLTLSVDVSGEAVALCSVRVGNTASKGIAFEWNPALSDMFAASDNERTLSVAKVDMHNPSKYSLLGEKKLEANINEISWSPKGKQLVAGDANGKIFQLKPEIELVRATNAPQSGMAVTSLSWLATTEWLVAYSNPERTSGGTFMLNIKKDKPPSWTPVDLSGQFSLGETRRLLVDWNIVIVALPGTGQLLGVCKPPNANSWSTMPLASLPQPSPASFVIGIAVDLSRQTQVTLGDGSTRRLPVLVALNSDGSLRTFQLSPPSKEYPDCNVSLVPVDPSKIQRGLRPSVLASSQNVPSLAPVSAATPQQSATPMTGLFAKMGEQKAPTTAFTAANPSGGLFGGAKATTQSPLNSGTPTISTSLFSAQPSGTALSSTQGATQATPKSSLTQPSSNLMSGASLPLFGKPATNPTLTQSLSGKPETPAQPPPAAAPLQEKTGPDPVEVAKAAKAALAAARTTAKENLEKFRKVWHDSHRDLHSFSINKQKAGIAIDEAVASLTHAENSETADEIYRMVCELDEELNDLMRMVVEKKELIEEKTATHKECRDIELSYRRPLDPLERTQSDSVMQKFEDFTIRLHEAKKLIAETKKISVASKPRRVSEFDPKFEGRLHESMKNMARYFAVVRGRVEDVERKALHFTTKKQLNSTAATADHSLSTLTATDSVAYEEAPSSIFVTSAPKPLFFDRRAASKSQQRAKMLEIMTAKKDIKITTKKVELLRIDGGASDDTLSSSFLNAPNLETSLYQKISSPHTVKQVLTMRNASTQADAPPVAAPTLTHTPSVTSALSSLAKQPTSTIGDVPKAASDKTLSTSGIVPLATSTPGFKLGDSSLKPSGSFFPSANPITPPSVSSQDATSKLATEVNSLGGKSIFGGLQSTTKTTVPSTESKPLFTFSTSKTTTETTNESKSLFGGLGTTGSLTSEKKELGKPSTLFGTLNEKAPTAASEKNEEKKSSLFGSAGAATSVATEKDEKPILFVNKAAAETPAVESKEAKPTSLFGGAAKQTTPTSIFGGGTLSKPLSFPSAQLAKPSETVNEKDQKDENSSSKSSEVKQADAKSGLENSVTSSNLTATTTATTTTSSSIFGKSPIIPSTAATTTTSSLFGTSISSATPATSTTTPTSSSLFGTTSLSSTTPATTTTTTTSSIFGTTSISSTAPATTTTTTTSSSIFGSLKSTTAQSSAFGSVFGAKDAGATQGSATGASTVTFSFKPKTEAEVTQPTASFTFTPKPSTGGSLGFAAAAAAAASSTDNDEGMDDDGAAGGASQSTGGSIFGGGFMSGIGSTTSANANKNVFGMGTSNLLKSGSTQPGSSSLFKTGQHSIFGGNTQTSSFATAAQQAAQSNTSPSSSMSKSVFGAAPKFGGPPVFGAKPVFGSPTTQQTTAFGGASATGGGFSSFSGNKSLFGGATSGGSSLFGGGTTIQNQPKSSLFGGGTTNQNQPKSSLFGGTRLGSQHGDDEEKDDMARVRAPSELASPRSRASSKLPDRSLFLPYIPSAFAPFVDRTVRLKNKEQQRHGKRGANAKQTLRKIKVRYTLNDLNS
ncbi:hypothetical protein Y032_0680g1468 [Ancylostoma ceylanicum]|uniref:Nucleoporin Nup159/Nup146 N-terminal domain-containing protein n=1 Tax=Ancylostoma ceylanicum TaxID=53326 RepID=A0A016WGX2_9BILA|nr:hypothetical protein Y032_0680g1468 [Ancylostoma ceylanicum]